MSRMERTVEATRHGRVLSASQLALLAAVQDRLIPREGELPGAGESGGAGRVDGFLAAQRDWRPGVLAALKAIEVAAARLQLERSIAGADPGGGALEPPRPDSAGGDFLALSGDDRDAVLRVVEAAQPRLFQRLVRVTYTAYYTDAAVQRAHGFALEPPLPRGYEMETFDESRLDAVKRRGKVWRDA